MWEHLRPDLFSVLFPFDPSRHKLLPLYWATEEGFELSSPLSDLSEQSLLIGTTAGSLFLSYCHGLRERGNREAFWAFWISVLHHRVEGGKKNEIPDLMLELKLIAVLITRQHNGKIVALSDNIVFSFWLSVKTISMRHKSFQIHLHTICLRLFWQLSDIVCSSGTSEMIRQYSELLSINNAFLFHQVQRQIHELEIKLNTDVSMQNMLTVTMRTWQCLCCTHEMENKENWPLLWIGSVQEFFWDCLTKLLLLSYLTSETHIHNRLYGCLWPDM